MRTPGLTDLYMHSVYYSMMLLEGINYDSYFPCTAEGTNYDYYCPPGSIVLKNDAIFHYIMIEAGCSVEIHAMRQCLRCIFAYYTCGWLYAIN